MTDPARRARAALLTIGTLFVAAYVTSVVAFPKASGRVLIGDATHHFVQLRSVVFDRDLHFANEYTRIYNLRGGEADTQWVTTDLTPTGYVRNYMPIGPALLWAPLYLVVIGLEWLLAAAGLGAAPDGFSRMAQLAPGVTGVLAATLGALASWRLARDATSVGSATIATIGIWLGTHAIYYSLVSPAYSHASSMFTSSLCFGYWLRTQGDAPTMKRAAILGALAGACALMRWQDALFVLVPASEVARWKTSPGARLAALAAAALAALAVFSPQLVVWHTLYGQAFTVPQGPSFMQWWSPHPLAVLLSDNHGLFTWTPLIIVALVGLIAFARAHRDVAVALACVVLGSWYVNAAVADWWAGEAYGARRFLSLFPLFVLGLAVWWERGRASAHARALRIAVIGAAVVANGLLLFQYQLFMKGLDEIAPYPRGVYDMWLARFVVPLKWLMGWST